MGNEDINKQTNINNTYLRILGQYLLPNGDSNILMNYIEVFTQELVDKFSKKSFNR